uniref:ASCH domain-containing protein n=1 Tax=Siphoviridae sp. ct0uL16 TaxID=2825299 RepID=A0A8S5Q5V2_9CAUD|nr:MAG TPA: hypothetical protein [Siphoviridae sp. ct0uL16]
MPKAVLLSVKPKYCELISSGKKTIEVRKTKPKLEPPFKCYIYCTKDFKPNTKYGAKLWAGRSKVIGEFLCNEIDKVDVIDDEFMTYIQVNQKAPMFVVTRETCLKIDELQKYLDDKTGYGWHISDLKIYDTPKELGEFYIEDKAAIKLCKHRFRWGQPESVTQHGGWIKGGYSCMKSGEPEWCENCIFKPLTRPPHSWCYVEEVEKND